MNNKKPAGIGKGLPIFMMVIMIFVAASVGVRSAMASLGKEGLLVKETGKVVDAMQQSGGSPVTDQEDGKDLEQGDEWKGVLQEIDEKNKMVVVYQIPSMEEVQLTYSGSTSALSRYGSELIMPQLEPGMLVRICCRKGGNYITLLQEDTESWEYKGVKNLEIDEAEHIMSIGSRLYRYVDKLTTINSKQMVGIGSLHRKDILTVWGIEETIYSIHVTKGHGTLTFSNYNDFVGGMVEIGSEVYDQVVEDMQYTMREGSYKLYMHHGSLEVNKVITITKGQTLVMDLNEYRNQVTKSSLVSFALNPPGAELYIDSELVDASVPVELGYGDYVVEVKYDGYETCSRLLVVDAPTISLRIDLADTSKTSGGDVLTELPGSWEPSEDSSHNNQTNDDPDELDSNEGSNPESSQGNKPSTGSSGVKTNNSIMIRKPEGASVYFDGEYVGVAPVQMDKITGEHTVTFKQNGYISKTYTIEIENDGEDTFFSFPDLTKE